VRLVGVIREVSDIMKMHGMEYFRILQSASEYFKKLQILQNNSKHNSPETFQYIIFSCIKFVTRKPSPHRKKESYPITGLDRPVRLQEVEVSRIFRQLAY
jgi:hypothetical protein